MAKGLEETTGLRVHILVGGPEPRRNGSLLTFTLVFILVIRILLLFSGFISFRKNADCSSVFLQD